jgi:hypothetical protein
MIYKDFQATDFESIPKGEKINARVLDFENNKHLKAFVFSEKAGVYSCLLPVNDTKSKLPELSGILIHYEQFKMPASEMRWHVLIECRTKAYLVNFTEILKEIISELDKGKSDTVKCLHLVISKWRHFLSVPSSEILSEENILGLLGELLLLKTLIDAFKADAISYWAAERGEEDFFINNRVIEVKATLKEKHEHVINGIDQLLILKGKNKFILSLLFLKSENDFDFNLPHVINQCVESLSDFPPALDLFFSKLKLRGYDHRDSNLYLKHNYKLYKGGYFEVNESFPRLTNHELIQPLNSRISKVRYTIDMEGLPNKDFLTTPINDLV